MVRPALVCVLVSAAIGSWMFIWPEQLAQLVGALDVPVRALSAFPFMLALLVYIEHPAPGRGVGKAAGALPKLKWLTAETPKPAILGAQGTLLKEHAYLIVFYTTNSACLKALTKAEAIHRRLRVAAAWFHVILVSASDAADVEAFAKRWASMAKPRSGIKASDLAPMVHDATAAAYENYMTAHACYVVPQAFVVDTAGVITWHGQINRPQCAKAVAAVVKQKNASQKNSSGPGAERQGDAAPKKKK